MSNASDTITTMQATVSVVPIDAGQGNPPEGYVVMYGIKQIGKVHATKSTAQTHATAFRKELAAKRDVTPLPKSGTSKRRIATKGDTIDAIMDIANGKATSADFIVGAGRTTTKGGTTKRNTKPIKASAAAKVAAPAKYTIAEIESMDRIKRLSIAKLEKAARTAARRNGSPDPISPVLDWFEAQGDKVPDTAKAATKGSTAKARAPKRPQVSDADLTKEIDVMIASGLHTWTKVARALQAKRMGRSHLVIRPIILNRLAAAGVDNAPKAKRTTKVAKPAARKATPIKANAKRTSTAKATKATAAKATKRTTSTKSTKSTKRTSTKAA